MTGVWGEPGRSQTLFWFFFQERTAEKDLALLLKATTTRFLFAARLDAHFVPKTQGS